MKTWKKIVSCLLCVAMLMSFLPLQSLQASAATYSGTCGDNLRWEIDADTGVLTISGTGAMRDYISYTSSTSAPWYDYQTDITSVQIGDSVTSIGNYAFAECSSLTSVAVGSSVMTIGEHAFYYSDALTSITIPDSVTSIGECAFHSCRSLGELIIPESVTTIEAGAFMYCDKLTSIAIPKNVTNIGDRAFSHCESLIAIVVDDANENYSSDDNGILFNKEKTELKQCPGGYSGEYTIPGFVDSIADDAFSGCENLTSVVFHNGVTSISDGAFYACSSLASVTIPRSITYIGDDAFAYCDSLTSVYIEDIAAWCNIDFGYSALQIYNEWANPLQNDNGYLYDDVYAKLYLNGTLVKDLVIPDGVTRISSYAFYGYKGLRSVVIPDSVTEIGPCAFTECENLRSVTLPANLTSIDYALFYGCTYLNNVIIPSNVKSIGDHAFAFCRRLESITIPANVKSIGASAFHGCEYLSGIWVDKANQSYCSDKYGVLFDKEKTELLSFPIPYCNDYIIPDTVLEIVSGAFYNCNLTGIVISNNITIINDETFSSCSSLANITIGNKVTTIQHGAFSYCTSLTSITIPDNVTSIGSYAFGSCKRLEKVEIGSGVTSISSQAFDYCDSLTIVKILNPDCNISNYSDTFGDSTIVKIYGHKDSTAQIYAEKHGYSFVNITCDAHSVTCISAVEPTCTLGGNITYWRCNVCGLCFSDAQATQNISYTQAQLPIDAHSYDSDNNCVVCGQHMQIVVRMTSQYDGWNGSKILVYENNVLIRELTIPAGSTATKRIDYYEGRDYFFKWEKGLHSDGYSFEIICDEETLYKCSNASVFDDGELFFAICNHSWIDATCQSPMTCEKCGAFDGNPLPHVYGEDGKCSVCGCVSHFIIEMADSCGDGWNGNMLYVYEDDVLIRELTIDSGSSATESIDCFTDKTYRFEWKEDDFSYECSFKIIKNMEILYECSSAAKLTDGETFFFYCVHRWTDATCQAPATCEKCGITEGDPLPHAYGESGKCSTCGCEGQIVIEMTDSCGDSWNGNKILVYENDVLIKELTVESGSSATETIDYYPDRSYRFEWKESDFSDECSFKIIKNMEILYECSSAAKLTDGETFFFYCVHRWTDATCQAPATCEKCGITEGNPLPHAYGESGKCSTCGCEGQIVIEMTDSYGDSWNGNKILVYENDVLIKELTVESGSSATESIDYYADRDYRFEWQAGSWASECSFTIKQDATILYECNDASTLLDGEAFFCVDAAESTEPELEPDLKFNMDIVAGAEMVVNYNFMANIVSKYSDFYLEVKKNVAGGDPVVTSYGIGDGHIAMGTMKNPITGEVILYNAAYTGINAKEMGDNFETTLYAIDANGKLYKGETVVSSIKDFLIGKLDDTASIPEMKTMAVDMLKYGAAAQVNFGYDADNLVTNSLSNAQLALGTQQVPEAADYTAITGSAANVNTNITVNSKVELSLSCISAGQADPAGVKCVINDKDGKVLAELATENIGGVMYKACYSNVGAKEMRKVITATFYNAEGTAISKTVRWSVESYVAQTRARADATETEIAMVDAMLVYGDSVAAYMSANGQ